ARLHATRAQCAQPALDRRLYGESRPQRPERDEGGGGRDGGEDLFGAGKVHGCRQTLMVAILFMMKIPTPMLQAAAAATIWPVSVKNSGPMYCGEIRNRPPPTRNGSPVMISMVARASEEKARILRRSCWRARSRELRLARVSARLPPVSRWIDMATIRKLNSSV